MDDRLFEIIWENIGSDVPPQSAEALRLVCRPFRDVIDKTVTRLSFHGPDVDFGYVAEQWQRWPDVKGLYLSCSNVLENATHQLELADFVIPLLNCRWKKLEQLWFFGGTLFNESAEVLATAAAESWPNIRVLDFNVFDFDPAALSKLGAARWERLEHLALNSEVANHEIPGKLMEDCRPLAAFLSQCPSLKVLKIYTLKTGDALAELMNVSLPHLEQFAAWTESFTHKLGEIIASKASAWPSLKVFELTSKLLVADDSRRALASLCEADFPLLETLKLEDIFNDLGAGAFNPLRRAMEQRWRKMKHLDLGEVAGEAFAEFLQGKYPFLETINYYVHQDEDIAAVIRAFADAGQQNRLPSLKSLGYFIRSQEIAEAVQSVLSISWPKVEKLEISSRVPVWYGICTSLGEAVKNNYLPSVKKLELDDIFNHIPSSPLIKAFEHPWRSVEHLEIDLRNLTGPVIDAAVTNLFNLKEIRNNKPWVTAPLALEALLNAPWPKLTTVSDVLLKDMPEESELCKNVADRWEFHSRYGKRGDFHRLHL